MQTPTAASSVFHVGNGLNASANGNSFNTSFPVDLHVYKNPTATSNTFTYFLNRLCGEGQMLRADTTSAESHQDYNDQFDHMDGMHTTTAFNYSSWVGYNWKRARGYFDMVTWTGTGSARTVSHNLGATPEMIWTKRRSDISNWMVYHSAIGNTKAAYLDSTTTPYTSANWWNDTSPTSSVFTVGTDSWVNYSGSEYVGFLFATAAGVSKVGSFTQSGATNVDCGFTGDTPAFILIKRTDDSGSWLVWDSVRGIIAGNDPTFKWEASNEAQVTNTDYVDPYSGGFATTSNITNGDYIFYAIAAIS